MPSWNRSHWQRLSAYLDRALELAPSERLAWLATLALQDARLVGERFRREGQLLARLAHPNIARLIDAGVAPGGQPYLVLEHIEGEHIDRYCEAAGLDIAQRVQLFLDVLSATAHAHANLIVRRDIKPANVLVSRQGHVKLLDEPRCEAFGGSTESWLVEQA